MPPRLGHALAPGIRWMGSWRRCVKSASTSRRSCSTENQFHRSTRCGAWDVNGLLAHLFRQTQRISTAWAQPPAPRVDADAISYWRRYDPVTNARRTVERVRQVATAYGSGVKLAMAFDQAWRTALDAAARTDPARPTGAGSRCWRSRSSSRPGWWS